MKTTELTNLLLKPYKGAYEPKFRIVLTEEGRVDEKGRKLTHYLVRQAGPGEPAIYEGSMYLASPGLDDIIGLLRLLTEGAQDGHVQIHFARHHAKDVINCLKTKLTKKVCSAA